MGIKRCILSATECNLAVQGHSRSSKVDDFGTDRKRVCDFPLVINSNFGPMLHRFRDTATYWLKIAYFSYPSLIRRARSLGPLWNFALRFTMTKLESLVYIFVPGSMGSIFIQICAVGSKRRIFSAAESFLAVQGHPRSIILLPIESAYAT